MIDNRMNKICIAATKLFISPGYSKTQISHIAKAIGVSVGTIYYSFSGKREIVEYILQCAIQTQTDEMFPKIPIKRQKFKDLELDLITTLETMIEKFSENLNSDLTKYRYEEMLTYAFNLMSRYAICCMIIEKNPEVFELLANHYKVYRKEFFQSFLSYVNKYIKLGVIRELDSPELSTLLMIETISWWTMDIKYSSFETMNLDVEDSRKVVLDNLLTAYLSTK